ncbi:MAG TPA: hypothetical protein VEI02_14820, partial [Planctomycetota bacterium]|nr:hypothetical protein [Planctomycetota bacterium]
VAAATAGAGFDRDAVVEFLGAGSVFGRRSLFSGVAKIPHGAIVGLRGADVAEARWSRFASLAPIGEIREDPVGRLADALVDALETVLKDGRGAVIDVTGGYDSRAILAAALRTGRPFSTVVNGADDDADVIAANRIARAFGLRHRHQRVGAELPPRSFAATRDALALTDGEFDALEYATVAAIHDRTAEDGVPSVNGSSGELCRGYWWDVLAAPSATDRFDARRLASARFAWDPFADAHLAPELLRRGSLVDRCTAMVEALVAEEGLEDATDAAKADAVYLLARMQRWGGRLASATARLRPPVVPFQFARPMAAALGAPVAARRGGRMAPRLVERLDRRLAAMPMAGGGPALPLRLSTAHRFLPRAAALGARALRRAARRVGVGGGNAAVSPVADAWTWPETADLLRPEAMATRDFYADGALARFFAASRRPGFSAPRAFGRALTLELTARALRDLAAT